MASRLLGGGRLLSSVLFRRSGQLHCPLSEASIKVGEQSGVQQAYKLLGASWRSFASLPEHTELQMPALSPTMAQGNVNSWEVKEGDELEAGTILATIETDKATLEWENQEDGFLAKILVEAGAKDVAVGTPLAVVVENKEDIDKFKDYSSSGQASQEPSGSASSSPESGGTESRESSGKQAESSHRSPDGNQRIGPAARLMLHQHHLSQSDVKGTGPYGIITKGDVLEALEKGVKGSQKSPEKSSQKAESGAQASQKGASSDQKAKSTQTSSSQPSGAGMPSQADSFKDVPNSQIRKIIASRLLESKQTVPHYYVKAVADLDGVNRLRESLKAEGTKVSLNDFVVRAVALTLAEVPAANATWDTKAEDVKQLESVDVAIAVATDKGLITPILKSTNTKSLKEISAEVRQLAEKARANKLKPEEFQGGTFTISNLGMFGVDNFSAIINPPQAGILAVGGTQHTVKLDEKTKKPVSIAQMNLVLSADQRVFDGATASKFLSVLCSHFANPMKLIL